MKSCFRLLLEFACPLAFVLALAFSASGCNTVQSATAPAALPKPCALALAPQAGTSALDQEITRFATPGYITQQQLEAVKAERAVSTAYGEDRASGFAHTLGFWWSVSSIEYYMGYIDNMAARTLADVQGYANQYIVGKHRIVGVLIDPGARKAIGLTAADLLPRTIQ